ncbi:hypothetical protein VTI28DRAFT_7106 [Corynascus sepedonium]
MVQFVSRLQRLDGPVRASEPDWINGHRRASYIGSAVGIPHSDSTSFLRHLNLTILLFFLAPSASLYFRPQASRWLSPLPIARVVDT